MKKKIFSVLAAAIFLNNNLYAAAAIPADNIFLLNYDSVSEGAGGSALAFSQNSLSFINSPSSNYDVLAARLDFAGITISDNISGGLCSVMLPTAIGNFTIAGSYNKVLSSGITIPDGENLLNNYSIYLNYVFPFIIKNPVYENIGGIGITLKDYSFSAQGNSKIALAFDIGGQYNIKVISDNLWAAIAFRNVGDKVKISESGSFDILQNFDFASLYNFYGSLKPAIMCDILQFFKTNKNWLRFWR
ncbi:MAG: hypothetical protein LBL16_04460 [Endomicrobium sp.]|jgi:hypothetical protein|nr:hypothetical protein [Endomicrobium sp.]